MALQPPGALPAHPHPAHGQGRRVQGCITQIREPFSHFRKNDSLDDLGKFS